MKAIVYDRYGSADVLRVEEVEKPVPADDEVLIKVRASSVNPFDWAFMTGTPRLGRLIAGVRGPKSKRLGVDVAGQVEAVGSNVTRFKAGDEVFGSCRGAFAEYVCTREKNLVTKPAKLTFEQAAAVPVAGQTALEALRNRGHVHAGQKVLINGAAGGVGTFAVQIAKAMGAHVTAVCSTRNVEMVRSLGADRVIDYTRDNFTDSDERYDVFLDNIGNHSLSARRRVLKREGIYVAVGGQKDGGSLGVLAAIIQLLVVSPFVSQKLALCMTKGSTEGLTVLSELMENAKVVPVIDRSYRLADTPQAMRHLEEGHARGKIVITFDAEQIPSSPAPAQ